MSCFENAKWSLTFYGEEHKLGASSVKAIRLADHSIKAILFETEKVSQKMQLLSGKANKRTNKQSKGTIAVFLSLEIPVFFFSPGHSFQINEVYYPCDFWKEKAFEITI